MTEKTEKKNKRIALVVTLSVYSLLLLAFALLVAWREPDPPLPEYGILVDYGVSDQGSGAQAVEQPSTPQEEVGEPAPEETVTEEAVETPTEVTAPSESTESTETFEDVTSPDVVPNTETEATAGQSQTPTEQPTQQETPKPKPPVNANALYPGTSTGGGQSQGNDTNAEGDKGEIDGSQSTNYSGTAGGGGDGASLDMAGWKWAEKPDANETSNVTGFVIFDIKVDDFGIVTQVTVFRSTLPKSIEEKYEQEVRSLRFIKTSSGAAPPLSSGRIQFTLKGN